MCHAWIAHRMDARAALTMSRRQSTRNERTHGWNARKPLLARDVRVERANRRTEHGERSTYQIKRSQHIPVILHMRIEF